MAEPRLGRNLSELLSLSSLKNDDVVEQPGSEPAGPQLQQVPVDVIQRGKYQPRKDMDVALLEELACSIRSQGVLQPIILRPITEDRYEIIAGERRWRAAQLAELVTIPAIIREDDDETVMALVLIENMQRENLNPMEEAAGISRLINDLSLTHQQVAATLGKSRVTVTNLLRLMSLQQRVKQYLEQGELNFGHAKVLLALEGVLQIQAANIAVKRSLSVRETEKLIKKLQSPMKSLNLGKTIDPDVRHLQDNLSEKLGATVKIKHSPRGHGKIVISYGDLDELDGILEHIN